MLYRVRFENEYGNSYTFHATLLERDGDSYVCKPVPTPANYRHEIVYGEELARMVTECDVDIDAPLDLSGDEVSVAFPLEYYRLERWRHDYISKTATLELGAYKLSISKDFTGGGLYVWTLSPLHESFDATRGVSKTAVEAKQILFTLLTAELNEMFCKPHINTCKSCGRHIFWRQLKGKPHPFSCNENQFQSHFSDCAHASAHRRKQHKPTEAANGLF